MRRGIIVGISLTLLFAASPAAMASAACRYADSAPSAVSTTTLSSATLCLVNRERTKRGRVKLRHNSRLAAAALRHARDMATRDYFAHDSPTGTDFLDRIQSTGYLAPANAWEVGENLAWGSGSLATPRAIVAGWMRSPGHRANILKRAFREAGIGVVRGAPVSGAGPNAATYANEFGVRR
jgi:uncharacterized protein YkwD